MALLCTYFLLSNSQLSSTWMGEGGSGIPSTWSPMVCESMCELVHLDYLFLSPKGGGDVEGRSPDQR